VKNFVRLCVHCFDWAIVADEKRDVGISYGSRLWFRDPDAPKEVDEGDGTDMLNNIHLEV